MQVGAEVPFPVDLHEMGLPEDLMAVVQAIEPCPPLAPPPGKLVLTTVNHLNPDVWELRFRDASGREEAVRPTGAHKFYSLTRSGWVSAATLRPDETLPGLSGSLRLVSATSLPGVKRVYNMTVEGEHVYHVSTLGAVAHNTCRGQHHLIPVALGSPIPYKHKALSYYGGSKHTKLQTALDVFLDGEGKMVGGKWVTMRPKNGNPGADVRGSFTEAERLEALDRFYRGFDGGAYYPSFRMELNVVKKLGGLL